MIAGLYPFCAEWHREGTVWLISDTHFGANLPNYPDPETHLHLINSKVGKRDTLIHLGDVGDLSIAKRLKGRHKVLVMGNHDTGRRKFEDIFNEIYEGPIQISERLILSHEPLNADWAFNIHGHDHSGNASHLHHNIAPLFEPLNFNQWMKGGYLAPVETLHRYTIDKATRRKQHRN